MVPNQCSLKNASVDFAVVPTKRFFYNKLTEKKKEIEREPRRFRPLKIPKKLEAELPFKSIPKLDKKRKRPTLETRRAVVLEPYERKRMHVIQQLRTFKHEKQRKQKEKKKEKAAIYLKQKQKEEQEKEKREKTNRKRLYRLEGLQLHDSRSSKRRRITNS
jgi:ribosome biogenesis protein BMS1